MRFIVVVGKCSVTTATTNDRTHGIKHVDHTHGNDNHDYGEDGICLVCGVNNPGFSTNSNDGNNEVTRGGCLGSIGMYINYFITVLIPAALVFVSKHWFI